MDLTILSGIFASPWDIVRSLVDIVIVAYLFYRILGLIKGTRAEQLLKGLVILLVFSILATYFNLTMVNWLMEKLWIVFAVTIPIVFQPELRRFLEQLGRGSFFRGSLYNVLQEHEQMLQELGDAVTLLSRSRIGALIIFTRETGINEYLESGTSVDALVSAGLLVNIFVPDTPLHDGATVISQGRIDRAACFLPLSDNPRLDRDLGTRHRAGIGITEVSDALAVIVSEETGGISLAHDGQIQRNLSPEDLRKLLSKELTGPASWRDGWRRRWSNESDVPSEGKENRA
ncbi:MAG TPA: diadenylate cyclase CdaA [Syntrophomonadaceae bacterium]|nr:diadenylate cyclase CdaA [Syntrophomonadaceae bacterium]